MERATKVSLLSVNGLDQLKGGIYGEVGECPLLIFKREGFSLKEREEISSTNWSALVMAKMIAQQ